MVGFVVRGTEVFVEASSSWIFPVDVDSVEEFIGIEVAQDRVDEDSAVSGVRCHGEEGVGEAPASDRCQDFQVRMGGLCGFHFFVSVVGRIEGGPGVVNGDFEVFFACAFALEGGVDFGLFFEGFVGAADGKEGVEQVSDLVEGDFVHRVFASVDSPFGEVGSSHGSRSGGKSQSIKTIRQRDNRRGCLRLIGR